MALQSPCIGRPTGLQKKTIGFTVHLTVGYKVEGFRFT
jgi:hypothetical protein